MAVECTYASVGITAHFFSGILAYIARNVSDIVILKLSSGAETDNSTSRKQLPVETDVIDRHYCIFAINYQRKYIYGMR
jgi:hypothetical protein